MNRNKEGRGYGALTPHAIGNLMREVVTRALVAIREDLDNVVPEEKLGYDGGVDVRTPQDVLAQEIYLDFIRENFPGYGVIAEEHDLVLEPDPDKTAGRRLVFTVDPADGTKALIRRQSHGIATMIALVEQREGSPMQDEVISAWIGDVSTREVFGFRPESSKTHRIRDRRRKVVLELDTSKPLSNQVLLLRDVPSDLDDDLVKLLTGVAFPGVRLFRKVQTADGSIGTMFARLWKGEVGAISIPPGWETPWDGAPILGISKHMGFGFYRSQGPGILLPSPLWLAPLREKAYRPDTTFVMQPQYADEVNDWVEAFRR